MSAVTGETKFVICLCVRYLYCEFIDSPVAQSAEQLFKRITHSTELQFNLKNKKEETQ